MKERESRSSGTERYLSSGIQQCLVRAVSLLSAGIRSTFLLHRGIRGILPQLKAVRLPSGRAGRADDLHIDLSSESASLRLAGVCALLGSLRRANNPIQFRKTLLFTRVASIAIATEQR